MRLESFDFGACAVTKVSANPAESMNTSVNVVKAVAEKNVIFLDFAYLVTYEPDKSSMRVDGKATFSDPEAQKLTAAWEKDGRIPGEKGEEVVNAIHYNASLALVLVSRAMNMTPPVVFPRMTIEAASPNKKKK